MSDDRRPRRMRWVGRSVRDVLREAAITGTAVVVPVVITVFVFAFLLNAVYPYVNIVSDVIVALPVLGLIPDIIGVSPETIVELTVPVAVFLAVIAVGLVVNSSRYGERAVDYFDYVMSQIPGVGSVYESFRRMSDAMLDSEVQNFRDVKLVEFPHEDAYTLGFVTTETPDVLSEETDHERMLTLFLPLAPNPVMGGHLVHVPASRVIDVDMSVEEGVQAIVTSGVAMGEEGRSSGLSASELRELTRTRGGIGANGRDEESAPRWTGSAPFGDGPGAERFERYDERVEPEHVDTPQELARRGEASDENDAVGGGNADDRLPADSGEGATADVDPEPFDAAAGVETDRKRQDGGDGESSA
ncbi:DUF502 domain-containing protein [Halopelagius fulvigenes]|uniref:DUF502 domain-containing protein n=1 Tax=Halopelagius fulvigenes TaxID=1198324 RepID=A0ABD5TY44_9EURY